MPRPPAPNAPACTLKLIQRARAELPADAIALATVHARAEVQIVRVLVDDLDRLVRAAVELRKERIVVLEEALEAVAHEAHQEAVALGAVERIGRRARIEHQLADLFERAQNSAQAWPESTFSRELIRHSLSSSATPQRSV